MELRHGSYGLAPAGGEEGRKMALWGLENRLVCQVRGSKGANCEGISLSRL